MKNYHYTLVIQWSEENKAFLVTLPEFEGCQTHGETYEEAARKGEEAIESLIESYNIEGRPLPKPVPAVA